MQWKVSKHHLHLLHQILLQHPQAHQRGLRANLLQAHRQDLHPVHQAGHQQDPLVRLQQPHLLNQLQKNPL